MDEVETARLHDALDFVGLRAHATAVGLLQLTMELTKAGVLCEGAVGRIKDAIARDIVLTRPRSAARSDYEDSIRQRLDALFAGHEKLEPEPSSVDR